MKEEAVIVEFYGIPRRRAGCRQVAVRPGRLSEILGEVMALCVGLSDLMAEEGGLSPHYLVSLNAREFLPDLSCVVPPGSRLLLLSADAGG